MFISHLWFVNGMFISHLWFVNGMFISHLWFVNVMFISHLWFVNGMFISRLWFVNGRDTFQMRMFGQCTCCVHTLTIIFSCKIKINYTMIFNSPMLLFRAQRRLTHPTCQLRTMSL